MTDPNTTDESAVRNTQYEPSSTKEAYRQLLKEHINGISFRLGVLVSLLAIAMAQMIAFNSLVDIGAMDPEAVETLAVAFDLMVMFLAFLLLRQVLLFIIYEGVASTGKAWFYALLGIGVALLVGNALSGVHTGGETTVDFRGLAYFMGSFLGLEFAAHGALTDEHVQSLVERFKERGIA